jgi:hypothetical protein
VDGLSRRRIGSGSRSIIVIGLRAQQESRFR